MARRIEGLVWARMAPESPWGPKAPRARGAKRLGLVYERAIAKALPTGFVHGQWFEFRDANGSGYCQPDFYAIGRTAVAVLEAKHTFTPEAFAQLEGLYGPILAQVFGKPVIGIQVCKNLTAEAPTRCFGNVSEAIKRGLEGHDGPKVVFWPGFGEIWGLRPIDAAQRAA